MLFNVVLVPCGFSFLSLHLFWMFVSLSLLFRLVCFGCFQSLFLYGPLESSLDLLFYVVVPFSLFYLFPEFALDLALGVA